MWLVILTVIVLVVVVYVPTQTLKVMFISIVKDSIKENNEEYGILGNEVYTEKDIENLPIAVQRFFKYAGYIGKEKVYNVHVTYGETDFKLSQDKPMLKIKYEHYNFLKNLERIASIETSVKGIPFDGLDNYTDGQGSMTGKLAKCITLFDVRGVEMDISSLVTCLSEMIFLPSVALEDYVAWESIDDNTARATIKHSAYQVSSLFKFSDNGEMLSVETDDRYMDEGEGKSSRQKWVVEISDYINENGINHPSRAKAIWKLDKGDYTYFDGKDIKIEYNVKEY